MLCINLQKLSFWINWLCDWNWASVNPLEELCLPYALDIQIKYGLTNQEPQKEPTSRSTWKYNLKKCCFPQICRFSQSATSSRETLGWHRSSHKTGVAAPKQFLPTDPTFTAAAAVTLLILAVNVAADADADIAALLSFAGADAAVTFTVAGADVAATHAVLLPLLLVLLVLQRKWKFQLFSTFSRWQSRHGAHGLNWCLAQYQILPTPLEQDFWRNWEKIVRIP